MERSKRCSTIRRRRSCDRGVRSLAQIWRIQGKRIAKNHGPLRVLPPQIRTISGLPHNCRALNRHLTKTCLNAVPRLCEMPADEFGGRSYWPPFEGARAVHLGAAVMGETRWNQSGCKANEY